MAGDERTFFNGAHDFERNYFKDDSSSKGTCDCYLTIFHVLFHRDFIIPDSMMFQETEVYAYG